MSEELIAKISVIKDQFALIEKPEVSDELFAKFCRIFIEIVPENMKSMELEAADRRAVRKGAHKLKGACGFSGAIRMKHLAAELEVLAEHLSDTDLQYFIVELAATLNLTRSAMEGWLEAHPS